MGEVPIGQNSPDAAEQRYDIRVTGHLAHRWVASFDGMTLTPQDDGTTVLRGPVADQSALHGLLRKLGDLGLPLISVTPVSAATTQAAQRNSQSTDRSLDAYPTRSTP